MRASLLRDGHVEIAGEYGLVVVEDAAQGLGLISGFYTLGTIGSMGTLSFHETKNIISGERGSSISQ